jgi:hypothetical protein
MGGLSPNSELCKISILSELVKDPEFKQSFVFTVSKMNNYETKRMLSISVIM